MMSTSTIQHPSLERLKAYRLGKLDGEEAEQIRWHLSHCARCAQQVPVIPNETLVDSSDKPLGTVVTNKSALYSPIPLALQDHPRYRILGELGEGGMGMVFKAEHKVMQRIVALKLIKPRYLSSSDAIDRFRREVRAAAKLSHPNIVTAYDAEQEGGLHYLVMEHVDGISLDEFVHKQKQPIPVGMACHFVRQVALGLQHASTQGMVHRDIKPQNLILTRKGVVKILDFGLSRLIQEEEQGQTTGSNMVMGTPDYIAPEQARNSRDVDIRADLYSLGCTLYFLLSTKVPFPTGSIYEKLRAHNEEPIPAIHDIRQDVPLEVQRILQKLMAKKPEDRYQTPSELAQELAPFARLCGTSSTTQILPDPVPPSLLEETEVFSTIAEPASKLEETRLQSPILPTKRIRNKKPSKQRSKLWRMLVLSLFLLGLSIGLWVSTENDVPVANQEISTKPTAEEPRIVIQLPKPDGTVVEKIANYIEKKKQDKWWPKKDYPFKGGEVNRKVLIVAPHKALFYPDIDPIRESFERNRVRYDIASSDLGECQPFLNAQPIPAFRRVQAKFSLKNPLDLRSYDAVLFVGGNVHDLITEDVTVRKHIQELIEKMIKQDKWIAAICTGQRVLAEFGFLTDREAARPMHPEAFQQVNVDPTIRWLDRPLVKSDRILTAEGPKAADHLAEELNRLMVEKR